MMAADNTHRTEKVIAEAAFANPRVQLVDITIPNRSDWVSAVAPAFIAAVFGFFTGVGFAQWAAAENAVILGMAFNAANQVKASLAIGGCFGTTAFVGLYVFGRVVGGARYYADFTAKVDERPLNDAIIPTARDNEMKRLTGRMRSLLIKFAQHYDEIGTVAIAPWYESKYLNRSQIEDARNYLVLIGAAVKDDRGTVSLSQWGNEQLPLWRRGDFGNVIELTTNSPTPDAA